MGHIDARKRPYSYLAPDRASQDDEKAACDLQIEVWKLLDLVAAEFSSDPMSTQCFDSRIVERVLTAVTKRKELEAAGIRPKVLT